MNYQQVIADAIKQTIFQTVDVDVATTTGSGSSFCCSAAAATTELGCLTTAVAVDAATMAVDVATTGFGSSFCCSAVAVTTTAVDADANLIPCSKSKRVRICEPSIQNTSYFLCNILLLIIIYKTLRNSNAVKDTA